MTSRVGKPDTSADLKVRECLDKTPLTSFIMVAGAGSGKTTSLVKALSHIAKSRGDKLARFGQKIACITYTDVAANEILGDVENSPLFHVSTIHSFLWTVVKTFQLDIKVWVESRIQEKIREYEETIAKPRVRAPTIEKANKEIMKLKACLATLDGVKRFNYGTGSDYANGILGHDDIIKMVPTLINESSLLRSLIAQQYPYIFVDESQDTVEGVVTALKAIDVQMTGKFCLGFFGDEMQKIYANGIGAVPLVDGWELITKTENFRCPQKVLDVINQIRSEGDGLVQTAGDVASAGGAVTPVQGTAKMIVLPTEANRAECTIAVREWIAKINNDAAWSTGNKSDVKILVIVHRSAANRLGFPDIYSALNDKSSDSLKDGFIEGTGWPVKPFLKFLLPLARAYSENRQFDVINLLRENCPQLRAENLIGVNVEAVLANLTVAVEELSVLLAEDGPASVQDVLKFAHEKKLMVLDDRILERLGEPATLPPSDGADVDEDGAAREDLAVTTYLTCPAKQLWGYRKYIEDESPFSTQQGIKGAEFPRVLTVLDDEEGSGMFLFSYNKYFGLTTLSEKDLENEREGKDTTVKRTRRLFYVCCSRALQDLVVVMFVPDVATAIPQIKAKKIFPDAEIFQLSDIANSPSK